MFLVQTSKTKTTLGVEDFGDIRRRIAVLKTKFESHQIRLSSKLDMIHEHLSPSRSLVRPTECLEYLPQHPTQLRGRLITSISSFLDLDLTLLEFPCRFLVQRYISHRSISVLFPFLPLPLGLHPLQHLRPLHVLHKRLVLLPRPPDFLSESRRALRIFVRNLLREVVPLESLEILDVPQVVMIEIPFLAADDVAVEGLRHDLGFAFGMELHPAVHERFLLVASALHPSDVRRVVFRGEEYPADAFRCVQFEEVFERVGFHEGRDTGDVDHAGFMDGSLGGGGVFGGCCGFIAFEGVGRSGIKVYLGSIMVRIIGVRSVSFRRAMFVYVFW